LVALTTHGFVRSETLKCILDARSHSERNGLTNAQWEFVPGALVDKARNDAVRMMLQRGHGWLLFVDADMTFSADAINALLWSAFHDVPQADIMGAYCSLRGDWALPTIDTGTGTWESHFPGSGILPVMRTGAAFLLVKRHVFERMKDPWFAMRVPMRPIDALAEVDNYARIKFDGRNPFRESPDRFWERLEKCASEDPSAAAEQFTPAEVGEDSGFCDRAKLMGFNIFVNTNIICGHIDTRVIDWTTHKKAIEDAAMTSRYCVGMMA
jgi:hypothetical protein